MTVRDAVGVRGRPDCQRSHPGTLRECPGTRCTSRDAFGRPETDSVSQDGRKRPGRLQRPGRSMASKTALASRTRFGRPRTRGVPGRKQSVPDASGVLGCTACVRDGIRVQGRGPASGMCGASRDARAPSQDAASQDASGRPETGNPSYDAENRPGTRVIIV